MAGTYPQTSGDHARASNRTMNITRWACLAGGGLAAYAAVRRGGAGGLLIGTLGGALLYQGAFGQMPASRQLSGFGRHKDVHLTTAITIGRPASELYDFWKGFSRLPQIMHFLESVEPRGGDVTHWVVSGPKGKPSLEWDAEVTEDVPNQRLAWRSVEGSELTNWGTIRFEQAPTGRGTEVHLTMHYEPPGGMAGRAIGQFLEGMTETAIKHNLRRFKAFMENGEIPTNRTTARGSDTHDGGSLSQPGTHQPRSTL